MNIHQKSGKAEIKSYYISKSVRLLPFTLLLVVFTGLIVSKIILGYDLVPTNFFLLKAAIIFIIIGFWICVPLQSERIIIDDKCLIYKKVFREQIVLWEKIKDVTFLDSWTSASFIKLKDDETSLAIDYRSFTNSEDLLQNILSCLKHVPIKQKYEFTEV